MQPATTRLETPRCKDYNDVLSFEVRRNRRNWGDTGHLGEKWEKLGRRSWEK
jgi:hypothetical protein